MTKEQTPEQREVQFYQELRKALKKEAASMGINIDRPDALFARASDEPSVKRIKLMATNIKPLLEKPAEDQYFSQRLFSYLNRSHARYAAMEIRKKARPKDEKEITFSFMDSYEVALQGGDIAQLQALAQELIDTAQQRWNRVTDAARGQAKIDLTDISSLSRPQQNMLDDGNNEKPAEPQGSKKSQIKAPISVWIDWEDFDPLKKQLRELLLQKGATSSTLGTELGSKFAATSLVSNGRQVPHQWNALGDDIRKKLHGFVTKHLRTVRGAHQQLDNILDQMRDATNYHRFVESKQAAEITKQEEQRRKNEKVLISPDDGALPYDKEAFKELKIQLRALVVPQGDPTCYALCRKYGRSSPMSLVATLDATSETDPIKSRALTDNATKLIEEVLKGENEGLSEEAMDEKVLRARGILLQMRRLVDYDKFNFKDNPDHQPSVATAHIARKNWKERTAPSPRHGGRQA